MEKTFDMKKAILLLLIFFTSHSFGEIVKVKRVIDGDTFETETGDRVRLLGIDTPEIGDYYSNEATNYLISLIEGKIVQMESDHISSNADVFDRLLRYIFLDSIDINKKMIEEGFTGAYIKYDFDKKNEYLSMESISKANHKGIWKKVNKPKESSTFSISKIIFYVVTIIGLLAFCYYVRNKM